MSEQDTREACGFRTRYLGPCVLPKGEAIKPDVAREHLAILREISAPKEAIAVAERIASSGEAERLAAAEAEQAALAIMVVLGPLVADAAIVGKTYGWREVLDVVNAAAALLRQQAEEIIDLNRELESTAELAAQQGRDCLKAEAELARLRGAK